MSDSKPGSADRSDLEKLGESAGAFAGRAADFGIEATGALVRSAAELLGGWWSTDEPVRAADTWSDTAEESYRSHYSASGRVVASGSDGIGAKPSSNVPPKSKGGAMRADTEVGPTSGSRSGTGTTPDGPVGIEPHGDEPVSGAARFDSATDGFAHARPGYLLGYVAKRNPAYQNRSFSEVEPELKRVWESRAKAIGSSAAASDPSSSAWPEVRGFVDFAFQQED